MTDSTYKNTLNEIQGLINQKYGSVRRFCMETDIEYTNLCKIFQFKNQKMSMGLFLRIARVLNLTEGMSFPEPDNLPNITLVDYLDIPHDAVQRLIFKINLEL